ncbi:hypothetical protein OG875_22800 [Streptomyces sp. NBC_01498]|uniref:hypothetical protein n=1 Tax=Streptomyces sp. NBC_01498 TaxID=2975870 RepID=UPI002E7C4DB5|nr:hypothetical protein [Streptomyces sp. NBC_01498]WTL27144.1 hypothetical protein OG875_22800 [Streptomyces sp. NBC_01498]
MNRALWVVVPAELALVGCLAAGVDVPAPVLLAAEAVVLTLLVCEAVVVRRHYRAARRTGAGRRAALARAVEAAVPATARRLLVNEARGLTSLVRWVARRRHGVREGDLAAPYTGPQTAMMYGLLFVSVVETVALALLIPWPLVHMIFLVLDVYGVLMVLALHASCVTRPHVVGADGSLRVRWGALFDMPIASGLITSARVERRYPDGSLIRIDEPGGTLDLIVGGQTTVRVELAEPVTFVRPLGGRGTARVVRFHADDPAALVARLTQVRKALAEAPDAAGGDAGDTGPARRVA